MSPRRALRRAAVVGGVAAVAGNAGAKRGAAAAQQQAAAAPEVAAEPADATMSSMDSKVADLKQLKELLDSGILTQDEFDAQKAQILAT